MRLAFLLLLSGLGTGLIYSQSSIDQVISNYENAKPGLDKIDATIGMVRIYVVNGDVEKIKEGIAEIRKLSREHNYLAGEAYALINENFLAYLYENDADKAIRLCEEAIEIAEESGDKSALIFAYNQLAENYIWEKGDPELGKEILLTNINRVDETVNSKNEGNIYKALGVAYAELGEIDEGLKAYDEALQIFREMYESPNIDPELGRVSSQNLDGEFHVGSVLDSMADLYLKIGQSEKAVELKLEALGLFKEREIPMDVAWIHGNLGEVYFEMGHYQNALEHLQQAKMIFDENGSLVAKARTNTQMIDLFIELEDFSEAQKYVEENLSYYKSANNDYLLFPTYMQGIRIQLFKKNLSEAERIIDEAAIVLERLGNENRKAEFIRLKGNVNEESGKFEAAIENYLAARELYAKLNIIHETGNTELDLGRAYLKISDFENAEVLTHQALLKGIEVNDLDLTTDSYELLSKIYEGQNEFEKAYKNLKSFNNLRDSIFTTDAQSILRQEQVRQNIIAFQNEKELAEENAALLEGRNRIFITVGFVLFFILILLGYLYTNLRKVQATLRAQNKQLSQLNTTKDKFFGIIAHDLRSPLMGLQSVGGQINYFLKKGQKEKLETLSDRIERSTHKLTELLDNLLNWALLQNGMIPYHPEKIDFNEAVNSTIELLDHVSEMKGVKLINNVPENCEVYADIKAVQTILRNIIANAIKFSDEGDKVVVTVLDHDAKLTIAVNDTGTGISAEQIPKLFNLNKQSAEGTKGEKGTGLGLILCKELVELNKGNIRVESNPGKGSSFIFELPTLSEVA